MSIEDESFLELFTRELLAGWVGGVLNVLIGHPLDTVRVRQQNQAPHAKRNSALQHLVRAVREEGFLSLLRGMSSPLAALPLYVAVSFASLSYFKRLVGFRESKEVHERPDFSKLFLAACLSGVPTSLVGAPQDLFKIVMQAQNLNEAMPLQKAKQFHSSFEVARHIVTEYGWNRCFRGLAPLLCRDVPGYGFYFLSYYYSKWYYLKTFPGKVSETVELQAIALAGSVAGLAGWAFTYPFDVLKTRIQSDFKREKYLSLADCLRKSLAESNNSLLTFYQGLTTTLVRSVPVNIALFCGYELGLYIYAKLKSQKNTIEI